ncbi:MAG: AraC family transcriptional regulator [Alphaproteobacteria bacterium]|nr:AraC family transcriptional regulator [Alphaproteobacteria bacterium]
MDLLSDILATMKLTGTLYFRTSFTTPWSIKVPAFEAVSRFHYAHRGRCLVRVEGAPDPVPLEQGDLVIIPRGASHTLYCTPETETLAMTLDDVIQRSGYDGNGTLVYGEFGTNHETQLVCGHLSFDQSVDHPVLNALPSHIHIRQYGETTGAWLESTLSVIGAEAGRGHLGGDLIATKLSEIIYAQALRAFLGSDQAARPVLEAFSDPGITRALEAIHAKPDHPWSLENLAETARLSRSSLAARFQQSLTMSPMAYVTLWRLQIARRLLADTTLSIIEIAERSGYGSEAAFGRVFKRYFNVAPATFRREMRA